jgi:hypothetical protein
MQMLPVMNILQITEQQKVVSISLATAQFSFFITENAVIDITIQEMVTNIASLHTFHIIKQLSKCMQPILKYSKNNMWFF